VGGGEWGVGAEEAGDAESAIAVALLD
jgi:hypothetical protein